MEDMMPPDGYERQFYETEGIDPVELLPTAYLELQGGVLHQWWAGADMISDGHKVFVGKWIPVREAPTGNGEG